MRRIPKINFSIGDDSAPYTPSSIDRFFWSKGVRIFGYSTHQWQLAGTIVSVSHSIAAGVFIILSLTIKGFPNVLPLIFGIAAIASLGGTFWNYRRIKRNTPSEIRISSSGRKLLYKIGQHIGWHDHDSPHNARGNPWATWWQHLVGVKTAADILTPKGAELLEAGCTAYNRLTGLLKLAKDSKGRSSTLTPQIQAASDEAMVSLVNQIALMEETPESQTAVVSQCQLQIDKLHELGERFEEILSGPITLVDRLSSTTVMDNVLDQLRMEAQAHEELRIMDRQE